MKHLKTFESFNPEGNTELNFIIDFVNNNSYFDYEGEENGVLQFSTRQNGDVGSETAGTKDIIEGKRLAKTIKEKYPNVDVKLEVVDEFVMLFVSMKVEHKDEYKYAFRKDMNGSGFTESFPTMDALIDKYGDWINVDWTDIKDKIEKIDKFPENNFSSWNSSYPVLIKKAGDEGNTWGYNFYIIKSKKNNK